jgi:CheY-like chemotaxis protein
VTVPHTILVVEDDPDIRESLRIVLEGEGYQVDAAANGREALDRLGHERPCLILLDLMMPVMSGTELLTVLRGRDSLKTIPVVVVSAYGHLAQATQGVEGFMTKPVALDDLLGVVTRFCGSA